MTLDQLTRPIIGQQVFASELPPYDWLRHCVRCARCLPVCPTYQETLLEVQSPRGRLSLIKAVEDGKLPFNERIEEHLYHCLDCRMCNTVCPAGVPIGEAILAARSAFAERCGQRWWRRLVFRHVLISANRLGYALWPLRWYQRLGLPQLIRPALRNLPGPLARLARMEALLPRMPKSPLHRQIPVISPAQGERRYRVGFFLGCMMSQLFADESRASVDAMTRFGCEVVTPRGQLCCGSPQDDQGDRRTVRELARRNIALFETLGPLDAIVSDCAACSSMLKEYQIFLHNDGEFAERSRAFSSQVKDIVEWYDLILPATIGGDRANQRLVTLHDACHLANAQGVHRPQRRVLARVAGLHLVEMKDANACCGSAGIYNITHPGMADRRLGRKLEAIAATGATEVLTNGPGCLLQLRSAMRARHMAVRVRHISELVDEVTRQE